MRGDGIFPIDPTLLEARLDSIIPTTGHLTDSYWHHWYDEDPKEIEKYRMKQRLCLARYARQNIFDWENREVNELQSYYAELTDMIVKENETSRRHEDQ